MIANICLPIRTELFKYLLKQCSSDLCPKKGNESGGNVQNMCRRDTGTGLMMDLAVLG